MCSLDHIQQLGPTRWGLVPNLAQPRQSSEQIFPVPQYLGQVSPTQHLQSPLKWKLFHSCNLQVQQD